MKSILRLLWKHLSKTGLKKILEQEYGDVILFIVCLVISGICGYSIGYNLKSFPDLGIIQITGIIILAVLFIIFITGTIFFAVKGISALKPEMSKSERIMSPENPLYGAAFLGDTEYEGNTYKLYKKNDKFYLSGRKNMEGFTRYGYHYIKIIEPEKIGKVYKTTAYCHYRGHAFNVFSVKKGRDSKRIVELVTYDPKTGHDRDLNFVQTGRSDFEKTVPFSEVEIREETVEVDINSLR